MPIKENKPRKAKKMRFLFFSLTVSSEMMQSSPGETPFFVNSRAAYPAATPPPRITYTNALPISFGSPSPTKTLSGLSLSLALKSQEE